MTLVALRLGLVLALLSLAATKLFSVSAGPGSYAFVAVELGLAVVLFLRKPGASLASTLFFTGAFVWSTWSTRPCG